jgi:rRNA-processing protein FCF1
MEVIMDSSFIVSCVRKKISFLEELENLGFKILVPKEVLEEMKDLRKNSKTSHEDRVAIELAFKLLNENKVKKTRIGNKKVDLGLIDKGKMGAYIATLDGEIKRQIPNSVIINKAKNSVMVERR